MVCFQWNLNYDADQHAAVLKIAQIFLAEIYGETPYREGAEYISRHLQQVEESLADPAIKWLCLYVDPTKNAALQGFVAVAKYATMEGYRVYHLMGLTRTVMRMLITQLKGDLLHGQRLYGYVKRTDFVSRQVYADIGVAELVDFPEDEENEENEDWVKLIY